MDYPKFIVSNQKELSISMQRVNIILSYLWYQKVFMSLNHLSQFWFRRRRKKQKIFLSSALAIISLSVVQNKFKQFWQRTLYKETVLRLRETPKHFYRCENAVENRKFFQQACLHGWKMDQLWIFLSHCDQTGKVTGIVLEGALC